METQVEIAEERAPKPHVAFLPSPGMGHTIPLFELAIRLVTQHNFQVSFLVIPSSSFLAQHEYLNRNQHPDLYIVDLPPADMSSLDPYNMPLFTRLCVIAHESIRPLRSVLPGLKRPKLKALVIDMFCTGVFDICKELSIPVYTFFTASTVFLSFSLYLPTMDQEVEGEFGDLPEPIKVTGCHPILIQDLIDQVRNRKTDDYKWTLYHDSRLSMATGIFVNTWDDLGPVYLRAFKHERFFLNIPMPPVYPIGPLTKRVESVLDEHEIEIMTWLDKQPKDSVLFVALGSGGTLTSEQLIELACGLELSQQRFILVVRKPNDYAAAGYFNTRSTDLDGPRGALARWVCPEDKPIWAGGGCMAPGVAVLNHPSTGALLSHCGWNSTLESVKDGVPMIAWPMYAEQKMNSTMLCNEVGVAVKMPVVGETGETLLVGRDEIKRVVRVIMEGDEGKKLTTRAKELEASGKVTLSRGGSSYETLAQVAESWKLDD